MKKSVTTVRKTYAPQQDVRRGVNKVMPAQNSTSTVPRILKQKQAVCPKCFVCDTDIEQRGFPLIMASTLSSKTSLPNKIGKLMGDGFMVIVSMDDVICKRCSSLFNHMDRLETDLERVQNTLLGYLKVKYKISDDEIDRPPAKMIKLEQIDDLDSLNQEANDKTQNSQDIESQLSNIFGQPVRITHKDEKNKIIKMYKCVACDFKTTDLQQFQPHYDKCKKNVKTKENEVHVGLKTLEAQGAVAKIEIKKFSCNICNFKISDKQVFEEHMKKHVNLRPFKCRVCSQRFENREQATVHARTHQPDYFKCGLCNVTFQKRDMLMRHLESHERNTKANTNTTSTTTNSTQRLLQASIEEALRDTANENDNSIKALENKQIEFYTCSTCSLTFLQESIYTQHMKQHRGEVKKPIGQSLIRQEVRTSNANIVHSQTPVQGNNDLGDGDLESIFEKMHSEKTEADVVTTTTNALDQVTFNITIPQDGEALDPEQQITVNTIRKHENVLIFKCDTCNEAYGDNDHLKLHFMTSGHGPSHSPPIPIDMPNLDEPESESKADAANTNSVDKMDTSDNNSVDKTAGEKDTQVTEEEHRTESNTDPVPMELEDLNSEQQQSSEIKLMLDSDNQLITSDGQILQLDNHILTDADGNQIITSSDGQILTVQGADNEQLQQLLQSVGVVVQQEGDEEQEGEGGEEQEMHMQLDGSQMIIVQTDSGEVQMTIDQAQEAGIDLSQLMAKDDSDLAEGEEKSIAFNLDDLCQMQEGETAEQVEQSSEEIENEAK